MIIRVVQGTSLGIFLSLITGIFIGILGISSMIISIVSIQVLTYIPAGYLAGKYEKDPFLSSGITGFFLTVLNLMFSGLIVGSSLYNQIPSMVVGLTTGLTLSLIGGVLSVMIRRWFREA